MRTSKARVRGFSPGSIWEMVHCSRREAVSYLAPGGMATRRRLSPSVARTLTFLPSLGVSGRLVAIPPGAKYDTASRRLQWTISQIDPGEKPRTLAFEVRMGGISAYEINVESRGDNALYLKDRKITDVQGMP